VLALMARLRRNGLACETDYAGRSLRGQLTHAQRVGAETVVVREAAGFTIRRQGQPDAQVQSTEELERALA
jgi:histidyl-tRNA synthetase